MTIHSIAWRLTPALAGALVAIAWSAAQASDHVTYRVERRREFDGKASAPIDLRAVENFHKSSTERLGASLADTGRRSMDDLRAAPHRTGIPSAFSRSSRVATFDPPLPDRLRGVAVYFVSVPRGGAVPPILAGALPNEALVLVVDAESIADVSRLAATVKRPISLATADVARRLGVTRRDSRVTVAKDGRTADIEEVRP